ncbi:MAG: hypothetical protein ABJH08_04290, partial [Balneola sp.]
IIPLEEELVSFLEVFPSIRNLSTEIEFRHEVDSRESGLRILAVQQLDMGRTSAMTATIGALTDFTTDLIVNIGIAGGITNDYVLGDICYSGNIIDLYDNSKISDTDTGEQVTEYSPNNFETPQCITSALNFSRVQPDFLAKYKEWQSEREVFVKSLVSTKITNRDGDDIEIGKPTTKNGKITCGIVSKSDFYNNKIKGIDRRSLAIDTESGGIFEIAKKYKVSCLAIRGISDYADKSKNKLEKATGGQIRRIAATNAASFFRLQLINPYFLNAIHIVHTQNHPEHSLNSYEQKNDPLINLIASSSQEIKNHLERTCPEYRLHEKGYSLPVPRVIPMNLKTKEEKSSSPIELKKTLQTNDRVIIKIPHTFPEKSLPWIIADSLISSEIDERQTVPIIINADNIRGASDTIEKLSSKEAIELAESKKITLVVVLYDFNPKTKHRANLVIDQINKFSNIKFIIISSGEGDIYTESNFEDLINAKPFKMCGISFNEVTFFVEKHFDMSINEAEVVALRLRDTFRKYALDAHPTYFAGISRETLATLLQANRRSELIELAVAGYLSFVVAGDKESIRLSRTTRARFLTNLLIKMKVNGETFTHSELVKFAEDFAVESDFNINPLQFIKSFEDFGILHFNGNGVQISLPFIESYLLANALSKDSTLSARYIKFDNSFVDYATLDISSEIGPSTEIIEKLVTAVDGCISKLTTNTPDNDYLLSDEATAAGLKHPKRLEALQNNLEAASKSVLSGARNAEEKQKILDAQDFVRRSVSHSSHEKQDNYDDDGFEAEAAEFVECVTIWGISVVVLGAGAEHLKAPIKRKLGKK